MSFESERLVDELLALLLISLLSEGFDPAIMRVTNQLPVGREFGLIWDLEAIVLQNLHKSIFDLVSGELDVEGKVSQELHSLSEEPSCRFLSHGAVKIEADRVALDLKTVPHAFECRDLFCLFLGWQDLSLNEFLDVCCDSIMTLLDVVIYNLRNRLNVVDDQSVTLWLHDHL